MKILFVYSSPIDYVRGGIQKVTYNMAVQFKDTGHEVLFLSFSKGNSMMTRSGFPQFFVPNVTTPACDENVQYMTDFVAREKIDVVINQAGMSHEILWVLSKTKRNCQFVFISCIHNSIFGGVENYDRTHGFQLQKVHLAFLAPLFRQTWMKSLLCGLYIIKNRQFYRCLCDTSDDVIVLTEAMCHEMIRMTGRKNPNVRMIPNGTIIPNINLSTMEKEKSFLYVGKLDYGYKRVDMLLPIWKRFSQKHSDWRLFIIGGGEVEGDLKNRVKKENIINIQFEGWKEVTDYYRKAAGLLLTSCSESFGMVLVEAMSYGVIPFAYDAFEQIHEIIDDGINGFLAPDNDPDRMASLMSYTIEHPDIAETVAQNAINKSNQFDSKIIVAKWLELIQ
jgi:glycosyltransferase involved in cell wall biosynthesis